MVMLSEPLAQALSAAQDWTGMTARTVYLSPQGRTLNQAAVSQFAEPGNLILLSGRYEGIDERIIEDLVDEQWSIGDYVLSGGELAAMVLVDTITRLLPGALGHSQSAVEDSFTEGLLDCPHYTRPEVFRGKAVPEVLLSGDHQKIRRWRLKQALGRTQQQRPDLLEKLTLNSEQQQLLEEFLHERSAGED